MYGYSENPNDRYDGFGINDRPTVSAEPINYIAEAKFHGFTDKEIKENFKDIVRYIDDCNKNDYRPF